MMGKLVLYHFSPQGKLVQHHVMNAPSSAMVRDFVTSSRLFDLLVFAYPSRYEIGRKWRQYGAGYAMEGARSYQAFGD